MGILEKLEKKASFGKNIGIYKINPLCAAITSHNIDTVRLLLKEGVNQEDKCRIYSNNEGEKGGKEKERGLVGRSKERKLKIEEKNLKFHQSKLFNKLKINK